MKTITCQQCGKQKEKYEREGGKFCNQSCYMDWKRLNPNKKAYKEKIFVSGYYYLYMPTHPNAIKSKRYIAEHRFVLEAKIGRLLTSSEIAHHINHNKEDNRPENLELLTISEHNKLHAKTRKRIPTNTTVSHLVARGKEVLLQWRYTLNAQ
jgi:hypothetical protein